MSSKKLTELEWKSFAKGKKLEDKDFPKALAALETAQRARDPGGQLAAFDLIDKLAAKLRSAHKADKEIVRYLDEIDRESAAERRPLEAEMKNAARKAEHAPAGGDDEAGPAALSTGMLPVLRQVPKGDMVMQAMVAAIGKTAAVLVSRRAIGPSHKKLLIEELGVGAGVKFMVGECIWESNAHTFVLEAKVSGLAKLVKAALLKQTGMRFKVRVRGIDPADVDEDGEEGEGAEDGGPQAQAGAGAAPSQEPPEKARYAARLAELKPGIVAALEGQASDAGKIKAVVGFAEGKAAEGNYKAGLHALESLAPLLADRGAAGAQPDPDAEFRKLTAELAKMIPLVQQAVAAHPDQKPGLLAAIAGVQQHIGARQLPATREALLALGRQLVALRGAPASDKPAKTVKVPTKPLMPIWADASESVMEQATEIIVKLRGYGDSELDRMADDLLETVNDLLEEVDDALEEYEDMSAEERSANAAEALDFLRSHKSDVAADALIRAADRNPLGVKAHLGQTMERALDEIAAAFEA